MRGETKPHVEQQLPETKIREQGQTRRKALVVDPVRVPREWRDQLQAEADREGVTRSDLHRDMYRSYLLGIGRFE